MTKVTPITPQEAKESFNTNIPDFVIESFNKILMRHYSSGLIKIYQDDAINEILKNIPEGESYSRQDVFSKNWLNVENLFRKFGWKVDYEKSTYGDSGKSYFTFEAKK